MSVTYFNVALFNSYFVSFFLARSPSHFPRCTVIMSSTFNHEPLAPENGQSLLIPGRKINYRLLLKILSFYAAAADAVADGDGDDDDE